MSQTIQISEKSASLLVKQAAARGLKLEDWIEELANLVSEPAPARREYSTQSAAEGIIDLQKYVHPDPDGWTILDYEANGRR